MQQKQIPTLADRGLDFIHHPESSCFSLVARDKAVVLRYKSSNNEAKMSVLAIQTPLSLVGLGLSSLLLEHVIEFARTNNLQLDSPKASIRQLLPNP